MDTGGHTTNYNMENTLKTTQPNLIGISGKIGSGKDTIASMIQYFMDSRISTDPNFEPGEDGFISYMSYSDWVAEDKQRWSEWHIKKFAAKLKDIVGLLIGCAREDFEDRAFKEKELGEEWWYYKVWRGGEMTGDFEERLVKYTELPTPKPGRLQVGDGKGEPWEYELIKPTPRLLLQLMGTECGRQILHPSIWENALFADYKPTGGYSNGPHYPNWIITDVRFPNEAEAVKKRGGKLIRVNRWEELRFKDYKKYDPPAITKHASETALDNYTDWDYTISNNLTLNDLLIKVKRIANQEQL